jgi:hypothetical protein
VARPATQEHSHGNDERCGGQHAGLEQALHEHLPPLMTRDAAIHDGMRGV